MSDTKKSGATAPQVKKAIDENRGDRIENHPAAAPLGTDAEAGAAETAREELKIARREAARHTSGKSEGS
ncbi:hypothetical protein GQ651_12080 [Alphaproteobacteria bacterium GH1-50]|uniref:Uncharacterized protein n=1 Tax=Kangsaoukella pontilimi TaxID=2691042 RepID=A0A7C9ISH1_9RHOB|nr:hypothetical protein [Kangsaoukella pontilimi]MXQ08586.1 hypothetical protein [Kangsaoukella pontilimi]